MMANLSKDGHIFEKYVKSSLLVLAIHRCKICNFCTAQCDVMSDHVQTSHLSGSTCTSALEELAGLSADMAEAEQYDTPVKRVLSEITNLQSLKTFPQDQVEVSFLSDSNPRTDSIPSSDFLSQGGDEMDDPCKKIGSKLLRICDNLLKESQISQLRREMTPKSASEKPSVEVEIQKAVLVSQLKKKNEGASVQKSIPKPSALDEPQSQVVKKDEIVFPVKLDFGKVFEDSIKAEKINDEDKSPVVLIAENSQGNEQPGDDSDVCMDEDNASSIAECISDSENIPDGVHGSVSKPADLLPSKDSPVSTLADSLPERNEDGSKLPESSVPPDQTLPELSRIYGNVDFQAIAQRASQSNPEATTITVVQHTGGQRPPVTIHFKKSTKSEAFIPTGQSLGIESPFTRRDYNGTKVFACKECHSRYKTAKELEQHVNNKHQKRKSHLCDICGAALATRSGMKVHMKRKHAIREVLSCDSCDYMTQSQVRLAVHMKKHNKETSEFYCEPCNKRFVNQSKLDQHKQSPMHKNAVNPIICEHCGYVTKKRDNFLVHIRKHTGEKPYRCSHCDYAATDGSTLKRHVMARHSNIRPFRCQVCAFSCVDKKSLTIHMRTHTDERPYQCDLCPYAAKRSGALTVHRRTHFHDKSSIPSPKDETEVNPYMDVGTIPVKATLIYPSQHTTQITQESITTQEIDQTSPALWKVMTS